MTWADPVTDLRVFLNDDVDGNQIKQKRVFPFRAFGSDGTIRTFYTFEDRLVCAEGQQHLATQPLRLWYDQTEVAASGINVLDALRGEFMVMGAMPSGVAVTAAYYYREWLDSDLEVCLRQGALQCSATSATNVVDGLQAVALRFAACDAHRKAAHRWQYRKTCQWLLEDMPAQEAIDAHAQYHERLATTLLEEALKMREAYYEDKLGQSLSPAYGLLKRTPSSWTPNR